MKVYVHNVNSTYVHH